MHIVPSSKLQSNNSYSTQNTNCSVQSKTGAIAKKQLSATSRTSWRTRAKEMAKDTCGWIFDRCPVIKAICGTSILFLTIAPVKKEWPTIREGGRGIKETCDSRDYHGKREKINFLGGEIDGCFSPNERTILIYFLAGCFVFASTSISARNVYAKFLQFSSLKR